MDAPPGVACLDTRYPRRLRTFGQVSRACLFMTDPQLVRGIRSTKPAQPLEVSVQGKGHESTPIITRSLDRTADSTRRERHGPRIDGSLGPHNGRLWWHWFRNSTRVRCRRMRPASGGENSRKPL